MSAQIIRNALCVVVRNQGEFGTFFVREGCINTGESKRYHCELTIQSTFGNVGHYWSHMGSPAYDFLGSVDQDYLLGKLWGMSHEVFDGESTRRELLKMLFSDRRRGEIDSAKARELYTELDGVDFNARSAEQLYNSMPGGELMAWLPEPYDIPWGSKTNPQAEGFWKILWPEFVQALKDEHDRNHCTDCGVTIAHRLGETTRHKSGCPQIVIPF